MKNMFLYSTESRRVLAPTQPPIELPEGGGYYSPQSIVKVKNGGAVALPLLYVLIAENLIN
jgi:hypothetical protein